MRYRTHCPACKTDTPHEDLYEKNACVVSRCLTCGLGRATPGEFDPASYYTKEYFDGTHADGYTDYVASEQVLRAEFARVRESLKQECPGRGRLLEIGCAYGYFLKEVKDDFDEVIGIELAQDAVDACHRAGLAQVHQGVADEATLERIGEVDVIVMLDVIEHLPDPVRTLELCRRMLKPGGVILLTTGDFASPLARITGRHWRLMTPPQHLWFFTPGSFARIAGQLGLDVTAVSHPWKLVPLSLILFQLARMAGRKGQPIAPGGRLSTVGIPVNLFDAMRVVMRKRGEGARS